MTDTNTATLGAPAARPTLLTVICIICFIMGAWGVFSGIKQMTMDKAKAIAEAQAGMEKARAQIGDKASAMTESWKDSALAVTTKKVDNSRSLGISDIILSLISLFGIWQMWKLRKAGFWIYLMVAIAGIIVPISILGGGKVVLLGMGLTGFISLVFIILFAVNLKHMQ